MEGIMNKLIFMSLILVGRGGGSFDTVGAAGDAGEAGSAGSITGGAGNGGGDAGNSGGGIAGTGGGSGSAERNCRTAAFQDFGGPDVNDPNSIVYCLMGTSDDDYLNLDNKEGCNLCSELTNCNTTIEVATGSGCDKPPTNYEPPSGCKKMQIFSQQDGLEEKIVCSDTDSSVIYWGINDSMNQMKTECASTQITAINVCTDNDKF